MDLFRGLHKERFDAENIYESLPLAISLISSQCSVGRYEGLAPVWFCSLSKVIFDL